VLEKRDVMFLPEYSLGKISETTTPNQFRLNREKYPLEAIFEAASLAGKRGKEITGHQIQLLQSKNEHIRYCAALGLRSQSRENLHPHQSIIIKAMQDAYPPVQITASAIAYDVFKDKKAEENLKKYSLHENRDL